MINILFVFGDLFKRGGTETVMAQIFDHIDRQAFHIDFLLMSDQPDQTDLTKHIREMGSQVFHVVARGRDYPRHRRELREFFAGHTYDIVHVHMDAIGDQVLAEAKRAGIRVRFTHSHNTDQLPDPQNLKQRLHKALILLERERLRRLATHFVACSTEAGQWLFGPERCRGDRYLLFRNAINPERLSFSREVRERVRVSLEIGDEPVLGHVGSFSYQKNHEFLIRAFAKIRQRMDAKLLLVGTGDLEPEVRRQVEDLGLKDSVLFLGSRSDVSELLQGMDLFLFPSRHEGLPLAAIEAQATGLDCLLSDTISREVDISGLVRFLPIDGDGEVWAEAVADTLGRKRDRVSPTDRIRAAGYDMGTNIRQLEDFYRRAVEEAR